MGVCACVFGRVAPGKEELSFSFCLPKEFIEIKSLIFVTKVVTV